MCTQYYSPGTNRTTAVVNLEDEKVLCNQHSGQLIFTLMIWLLAVALSCALLSTLLAAYLQLGNPTRETIFWIGIIPGISLFITGILGSVSLVLWQKYYLQLDNGDCLSITVAATIIAYVAAISMVIRWRWPGICAIPNEQQALGSRSISNQYLPHCSRRRGSITATTRRSAPALDLESVVTPLDR